MADAAIEPLTAEEELQLVRKFHQVDLRELCDWERLKLPARVKHTAAMFFSRVYLTRSVMDFTPGGALDPRVVMCTVVLIASKAEEMKDLDVRVLEERAKVPYKSMLALEPDVLAALRFDLCVHTPVSALAGALASGTLEAADDAELDSDAARELRRLCEAFLDGPVRDSDAIYLFSPQQLALAALSRASTTAESPSVRTLASARIRACLGAAGLGGEAETVRARIDLAAMTEASAHGLDDHAAHELYHRVKLCHQYLKTAAAHETLAKPDAAAASVNEASSKRARDEANGGAHTGSAGRSSAATEVDERPAKVAKPVG